METLSYIMAAMAFLSLCTLVTMLVGTMGMKRDLKDAKNALKHVDAMQGDIARNLWTIKSLVALIQHEGFNKSEEVKLALQDIQTGSDCNGLAIGQVRQALIDKGYIDPSCAHEGCQNEEWALTGFCEEHQNKKGGE